MFRGSNSVRFIAVELIQGEPSLRIQQGVFRSCGTVLPEKCQLVHGGDIPELDLVHANGTRCYCTTDLCNGPHNRDTTTTTAHNNRVTTTTTTTTAHNNRVTTTTTAHNSTPALVIRSLAASVIAVISLLAWITARFLRE